MEHNLSSRSADEREEFGQLCCHSCLRDWWWVVLGLCFQRNSYHTLLLLTPICCCYSLSHVTPWTAAHQASLFITISLNLLKLMSIESIMPSNHRLLCRPLLLLPFTFPRIRVFSNESALCIRWPKYWSFSISPSNEYSGLISFRIDLFDILAIQRTLKILISSWWIHGENVETVSDFNFLGSKVNARWWLQPWN